MEDADKERYHRHFRRKNKSNSGLATGHDIRRALYNWFSFYNEQRPHAAVDYRKHMDVFKGMSVRGRELSVNTGGKMALRKNVHLNKAAS